MLFVDAPVSKRERKKNSRYYFQCGFQLTVSEYCEYRFRRWELQLIDELSAMWGRQTNLKKIFLVSPRGKSHYAEKLLKKSNFKCRLMTGRYRSLQRNLPWVLLNLVLISLSSNKYDPLKAEKLILRIARWYGFGLANHDRKIDWSSTKDSENYFNLKRTLLTGIAYFAVNLDFERLESFLIKVRYHLSPYYLQKFIPPLVFVLRRNIDHRILSAMVLGTELGPVRKRKTVGAGFRIDGEVNKYLKEKGLRVTTEALFKIGDRGLKRLNDSDPFWCYNALLEPRPSSFKPLKQAKNLVSWAYWDVLNRPEDGERVVWSVPGEHEIKSFSSSTGLLEADRAIRNEIRRGLGLPQIGEGWLGEAELLKKIRTWFPQVRIVHQWRPKWLGNQRIDVGMPELGIAIEFHGLQHFEPVVFFGGKQAFLNQRDRDKKKRRLCKRRGVKLLVFTEQHKDQFIKRTIQNSIGKARIRNAETSP